MTLSAVCSCRSDRREHTKGRLQTKRSAELGQEAALRLSVVFEITQRHGTLSIINRT